MRKVIEAFNKLYLIDRLFIFLGFAAFVVWGHSYGLFSGNVDDWCYWHDSQKDPALLAFYLMFILPFAPAFLRKIIKPAVSGVIANGGVFLFLIFALGVVAVISMFSATGTSLTGLFNKSGSGGGFSVGGAKDIQNFRKNIQNNNLPAETDITYEGLFYDYYFNIIGEKPVKTFNSSQTPAYFTPVYSWAPSLDPFAGTIENYITIGLRSELDMSKFKRKKLNIVVVLDISGSMSSPFDEYYYDRIGDEGLFEMKADTDKNLSKLEIASRSICALLNHLDPGDSFGMILFDDRDYLAKPSRKIGSTNLSALKTHILALKPRGSTNMEAGYRRGRSLLKGCERLDPDEFENRIIFLTDAMPNTGSIDKNELVDIAKEYSKDHIYTTFVGIGVDFQTELIEYITKVRGANYYSIHSSWEFKKRMDREFDYMVNPMLFNLRLSFDSAAWKIDEVYGSPEANLSTGELMRVNTLFPAPSSSEGIKGGVIVLKLKNNDRAGNITLSTSYETRSGAVETASVEFAPPAGFDQARVEIDSRKAVLLSRYVKLMKEWLGKSQIADSAKTSGQNPAAVLNNWEHQSSPLFLAPVHREKMVKFLDHFTAEVKVLNDTSLDREKVIMEAILKHK